MVASIFNGYSVGKDVLLCMKRSCYDMQGSFQARSGVDMKLFVSSLEESTSVIVLKEE
jgi:hypothetical protein